MHKDKNTERPFSWIADVCSLYISPFSHEYVVNVQHRRDCAADSQRVLEKLTGDYLIIISSIRKDRIINIQAFLLIN